MVENLDFKIGDVIARQEMDFLASYQAHMRKIAQELEVYKRKTNENEFLIRKDDKVLKLQNQVDWFRKEAMDLAEMEKQNKRVI